MHKELIVLVAVAVTACDSDKPEISETCGEHFTQTACVDLVGGSSATLEFDSFSAGTYCVEFQQTAAKPNRITSGRLTLDSQTELMGSSDFSQKVLSVARVFEAAPGSHQLRFESTATKNASAQLCLHADLTCHPIEDAPEPENYDALAEMAISQLSSEGILETSNDPLTLVVDRMASLLNVCPEDMLANAVETDDAFRHYTEDPHAECIPISPYGDYIEDAQYCGRGSCAPGTFTTPKQLHYVNQCINEHCQGHDICYDSISPGEGCYWTKYTFGCDLTLASAIQSCNVPDDEEGDTKAERKEKKYSRWAKSAIAGLAAYAATDECCSLTTPAQIGSECADEPLEGQPGVYYCISFATDAMGSNIIMTMTRSDGTSFGGWHVAVDLELEIDGVSKTLRGNCAVHDGDMFITQEFASPTIGENKTATGTAHVRVAPDYESCKSQAALEVSSATLTCDGVWF